MKKKKRKRKIAARARDFWKGRLPITKHTRTKKGLIV